MESGDIGYFLAGGHDCGLGFNALLHPEALAFDEDDRYALDHSGSFLHSSFFSLFFHKMRFW
jgi:hypothetical protein